MTSPVIRCIGQVPGCPQCDQERLRRGDHHTCDELCVMQRDVRASPIGHRRSHEPKVHDCGTVLDDRHGTNFEVVKFCGWGTCVQFVCPGCDGFVEGFGPMGCQCENEPCGHGSYEDVLQAQPAPTTAEAPRPRRSLFRRSRPA